MQIIGDLFNTLLFRPIVTLLVLIYQGLSSLGLPGAFGFTIIILTVAIRLLVWPFMSKQLKSAKKMAELKPHLDTLKEKHKGDKQALASAQMALYKEHGVNPAGGCLPTLIQIPIIIALYQTIFAFFGNGQGLENINKAIYFPNLQLSASPNLNFFGINLAAKPADFGSLGVAVLLIPDMADSMSAVQGQMMYMMPLMIGYFAFQFPIGLALYWNVFTILGIIQQYLLSGWGGIEGWVKVLQPKH
ncbi:MAG: Preprotein translocase YidC subunit [Candidatus Daviesbacteria bacterium GW2011_GWA2_42_7]|uniref:Preprotein translocase YidC subunit n=1 Tax=Candidatus Daviesbacteria bacterium GW2011_GWA2_42_7 TaxID=1618425 RepID=A0A0G1E369_9BACT|nr:MAG: Preprotein translocase YidC subunit [Candidatus Daviesbacteria bacterium GW2011_GWA2_42_7]